MMNGPDDDQQTPEKIGRYVVLEVLGSGGFGKVYSGLDRQLDRRVAIKVPRRLQSPTEIDEFLREAKRLAQLRHPGIVAVYDVGRQDDYCYIITELVEGRTLGSVLKSKAFTWQEACDFVAKVAEALAHAHAKSMIHRDIKPGNIMVRHDGHPVILDFGLALTDIESSPTGFMQGTPAYMAPEQARGEGHRVDGRTDIYSLGVVLYQMLTGRLPFRSTKVHEVIRRVLEEEPQPLRQLAPHVHPEVASVCTQAMAKKMENRFVTATDFAHALRAVITPAHSNSLTVDLLSSSHVDVPQFSPAPSAQQSEAGGLETEAAIEQHDTSHSQTRPARGAVKRRVTVAVICFEASIHKSPLDAEQDYEVTQQVLQFVNESVAQLGGVVLQSGHDIVACFGYPKAYEDAAHRSIRATRQALAKIDEWAAAATIEGLEVESWALIHTDDAIVEDRGGGSTDVISLSGEAIHTATKLAPAIEGQVLAVTETTRDLAGNAFEYEGPETKRTRGVSRPVDVYRVTKEFTVTNRVELVDPGNLTPLIGRSTELAILKDRWEQAAEGMGQVVLLIGDAGLGKSRLIREIREHVVTEFQDELPLVIELRCSAYHQNTGFYPLTEYFYRLLDFQGDTPADVRWNRLTGHLSEIGIVDAQEFALMALLIGVPIPSDQQPLNLPPQRIRESTQELLLKWLRLQASRQPCLFVVEDLHWADPTGLDVLRRHVEEFEADSILTVLTFRPEFQTPWRSLGHQTQIALNRLTKRQIGQMLQQLAGQPVSSGMVQQLIDRTDGIPLFVEEFAKMLGDAGAETDAEGSITESQVLAAIPASLQDLLAARLDRIGSDQDVVQLAAAIGREFGFELLLEASSLSASDLRGEIAKLTEAEILFQRGELPNAQLIFKHALIQDSAYQSMLSKQRCAVHLRIARVLEQKFPDITASQPELLAQHFTAGGEPESAVDYWRKAAIQSQNACTYDEAIHNLRQGLEVLKSLPESPERDGLELHFQVPLAMTIMTSRGYAHPDLNAVHSRARILCEQLGGDAPLFHVVWGIWAVQLILDEMANAKDLSLELLAIANERDDPGLQMEAWFSVAITTFYRAEFTECLAACEHCAELEDRETCVAHSQYTGQNAGMAYRCYWALVDWYLGRPDTAIQRVEEAIEFARGIEHPFSLAYALHHAGWLYTHCRFGDKVLRVGQEGNAVATEQGFAFWIAMSNMDLGTGRMVDGNPNEALPYIEKGLEAYLKTGSLKSLAEYHGFLGEIHLRAARHQQAISELDVAIEAALRTGNRCYLPEVLRLRGEALLQIGNVAAAEADFNESLRIAKTQQALCWQLRTATSLARLWSERQRLSDARALLTSVYEQFDEGFSTPDLQDAAALIDQLSLQADAND